MLKKMGAWESRTLSNDDAQDFLGELMESSSRWKTIFKVLTTRPDDLTGECSIIAAAEVVAAAKGYVNGELPPEVAAWAARPPRNLDELIGLAVPAVETLRVVSEVKELYENGGTWKEFNADLQGLVDRLKSTAIPVEKPKRIRPKSGDVFQFPLPGGEVGYLRLCDDLSSFWVYDWISSREDTPPIGSRNYRFAELGMWEEIRSGFCPRVGNDPWIADDLKRKPKFVRQVHPCTWIDYPMEEIGYESLLRFVYGTENEARLTPVEDCIGAPRVCDGGYRLAQIAQRMVEGEDGPFGREHAGLVLCDEFGDLHYMGWSDWRLEWWSKMPKTYREYEPKMAQARHELEAYKTRFYMERTNEKAQLDAFLNRYDALLQKYQGRLPSYGSRDEMAVL